jgi:hypothetical protein
VFHGIDADGMGYGSWLLPIEEHSRIVAQLDGERSRVFDWARGDGVRESAGAYTAAGFCRILDRAARKGSRAHSDGDAAEAVDDWSFAKVIVRVDLGALAVWWARVRCVRSPGGARSRLAMRGG